MSERDDFLSAVLGPQAAAEAAIHDGDPSPRMALWSPHDPVTLFGAFGPNKSGWDEVSQTFQWVASRFSDVSDYRFELVAAGASGDLAYTVGYEHSSVSLDGAPPVPRTLRVTHVYRREQEQWKIVHRHGDVPPPDQSLVGTGSTSA